uniref:Uncharacterized protein n=1 Tax=Glossina pallidipes TaxID=7398 RepID=A0A1B0ABM3_GLOPL
MRYSTGLYGFKEPINWERRHNRGPKLIITADLNEKIQGTDALTIFLSNSLPQSRKECYQDNKHWLDFEKSWLSELNTYLHYMKLCASSPLQLEENITVENRHSRYVVFFLEYIHTRLQSTGIWETLTAIFTQSEHLPTCFNKQYNDNDDDDDDDDNDDDDAV